MEKDDIIKSVAERVKEKMLGESTGHDWWHVYRVWKNAIYLAEHEKGIDVYVVQLAALLHDIADWKFSGGDTTAGAKMAREMLEDVGVERGSIEIVCDIVENVSFKGGFGTRLSTKEGMIVQDADRLDALGAIGIARAFAYGGSKGREIYNPGISPLQYRDFEDYKKSNSRSTTVNHFYEKLFLLTGQMGTEAGRRIAREREEFMKEYLDRFYEEWNGRR